MTQTPSGLGERIGQSILDQLPSWDVPSDLTAVADLLGVAGIREREMFEDGRVIREEGRPVIELAPREGRSGRARQRFTLAHELAHVALASPSNDTQMKRTRSLSPEAEEILCDRIAAAVLMPRQWVVDRCNRPLNLSRLTLWASRAEISVSTMAVRLAEVQGITCYLLRFRMGKVGWVLESRSGMPRELVGRTVLGTCLERELAALRHGDHWREGHIRIDGEPLAITAHVGMRKGFCLLLVTQAHRITEAALAESGCKCGRHHGP
ncbi:MAG: ImmA/IrrE family metallo-endopeptidase [Acidimicrobiia bacterium]